MNTKNRSSAFPFRRSGGKKRPKSNKGRGNGNNYRSLPGNLGDLMSVMPSATKAVAQLISGNTRPSGQVAHARSVLAKAQKAIDDRLTERLQPAIKDDFLEQVALLRLTLADASSMEEDELETKGGGGGDTEARPAEISMDKLRALALSIAGNAQSPAPIQQPLDADDDDEDDFDHQALTAAKESLKSSSKPNPNKTSSAPRGINSSSDKLRLKTMLEERRNSNSN